MDWNTIYHALTIRQSELTEGTKGAGPRACGTMEGYVVSGFVWTQLCFVCIGVRYVCRCCLIPHFCNLTSTTTQPHQHYHTTKHITRTPRAHYTHTNNHISTTTQARKYNHTITSTQAQPDRARPHHDHIARTQITTQAQAHKHHQTSTTGAAQLHQHKHSRHEHITRTQ